MFGNEHRKATLKFYAWSLINNLPPSVLRSACSLTLSMIDIKFHCHVLGLSSSMSSVWARGILSHVVRSLYHCHGMNSHWTKMHPETYSCSTFVMVSRLLDRHKYNIIITLDPLWSHMNHDEVGLPSLILLSLCAHLLSSCLLVKISASSSWNSICNADRTSEPPHYWHRNSQVVGLWQPAFWWYMNKLQAAPSSTPYISQIVFWLIWSLGRSW
jgi:hypothetical protein